MVVRLSTRLGACAAFLLFLDAYLPWLASPSQFPFPWTSTFPSAPPHRRPPRRAEIPVWGLRTSPQAVPTSVTLHSCQPHASRSTPSLPSPLLISQKEILSTKLPTYCDVGHVSHTLSASQLQKCIPFFIFIRAMTVIFKSVVSSTIQ